MAIMWIILSKSDVLRTLNCVLILLTFCCAVEDCFIQFTLVGLVFICTLSPVRFCCSKFICNGKLVAIFCCINSLMPHFTNPCYGRAACSELLVYEDDIWSFCLFTRSWLCMMHSIASRWTVWSTMFPAYSRMMDVFMAINGEKSIHASHSVPLPACLFWWDIRYFTVCVQ